MESKKYSLLLVFDNFWLRLCSHLVLSKYKKKYHWYRYIMVMPNIYSMKWIYVKPPTMCLPSLISVNKLSSQHKFRRSLFIQPCQSSLQPYISCSNCSIPATILPASLHFPFSSSNSFSFPPHCIIMKGFLLRAQSEPWVSSLLHRQQAKFIYHYLAGLNGQANSWKADKHLILDLACF